MIPTHHSRCLGHHNTTPTLICPSEHARRRRRRPEQEQPAVKSELSELHNKHGTVGASRWRQAVRLWLRHRLMIHGWTCCDRI
ncbi:unnamed protein product [Musa acuminata subsp. burmannicoides]